jgi:urease accessory protein
MKKNLTTKTILTRVLPVLALLLVPSLAQAHPGGPHTHSFANGFTHPFSGLDHLCAMVAVGLFAAQRGGRALWLVPLTFVSFMAIGGVAGMGGTQIGFVEQGIATSVLILGMLIMLSVRLPLAASMALVAVFALFHGFAHGAEMPANASGLKYAVGFLAATMMLHLAGLGAGLTAGKMLSAPVLRYAGGAITACGLYLCVV